MRHARSSAALIVVATLVLAGCSGGQGSKSGGGQSPTASEPTSTSPSSMSSSQPTLVPTSTLQATTATHKRVPIRGRLYFTHTTAGDVQTVFAASGLQQKQLTEPGEACCVLRKSPRHGLLLVMPGGDIEPPITGGTINLNGDNFTRLELTDPTLNLVPQAWSPDGRRIAFEGWDDADPSRTGIYTARAADGTDLVRVTNRPGQLHDIPLDYSPDGTQLVFYRSTHADPDPHTDGSLWVVNVDGSGAHRITTAESPPADWARWSPDGTRILFASERLSPAGPIWTVSPTGTGLTKLFEDKNGGFAIAPEWSPDGKQIVFGLDPSNDEFEHPSNKVYLMSAQGTHARLVDDSDDFKRQFEWSK